MHDDDDDDDDDDWTLTIMETKIDSPTFHT